MADRSVVVRLRAEVASYIAGLKQAQGATNQFGREISGVGTASRADLDKIGRGAMVFGAVMAAGIGLAANAAMDFEKQLSELSAVSSASSEQMLRLRDAAIEAGAATQFSATEAALAQTELAKAGISTADVLGGGLKGALDLAAAGGLDLGRAAEIAATSMTTFGLTGQDVTRIADVLAAGANKSAADVTGMADALAQSGLVADQFGLSIEESVGVLSMFAQNGLKGSDAGTSLKTALQRLVPTSVEAAEKMRELGIDMFDASGNFVGIDSAAEELKSSLSGLSEEQRNNALATIFGSDAVRAATILYEGGAAGVREWTSLVDDTGFAAEVAAIRMDNLSGDIETLQGSIETTLIGGGSEATGALRALTQGATDAVNGFAAMPDQLQAVGLGFGAAAGGASLLLGGIAYAGPRIKEAKAALNNMGAAGEFASRNMGKLAAGMAGVGVGLGVLNIAYAKIAEMQSMADDLVAKQRGIYFDIAGAEDLKRTISEVNFQWGELTHKATSATNPFLKASYEQAADGFAAMGRELERIDDLSDDLAVSLGISGDAATEFVLAQQAAGIDVLAEDYRGVKRELEGTFATMTTGTPATHTLATGLATLGDEAVSVEDQISAFSETLDALWSQMFGIQAAEDDFQRGLNDLPEVLEEAAKAGLNLNDALTSQSDAALDVRSHMRDLASDAVAMIEEWREQGITGEELAGKVYLLSESFRQQALDAGLPGPVVDEYLALLGQIPLTKHTAIDVETAAAEDRLDRLLERLGRLTSIGLGVSIDALQAESQLMRAVGRGATPRAGGGHLLPGVPYLFGERGPEVGVFGTAGHMFSSVDSASLARPVTGPTGGGGGYDRSVSQTNHITVPASTRRLARDIAYELDGLAVELAAS